MKIFTFLSDKGGAGATMFNVTTGAYLLYIKSKRVCIVDTVTGNRNLTEDRLRETNNLFEDNYSNTFLTENDINSLKGSALLGAPLHIYKIDQFEKFLTFLKDNKDNYDYIILDCKGVTESNIKFLFKCSFIFLVTDLDDVKMDVKTYHAFNRIKIGDKFHLENVKMFFNKVEKGKKIDELKKSDELSNIDFFLSICYYRPSIKSIYNTFSGILPESKANVAFDTDALNEEVYNLIENNITTTA